MLQVDGYDGFRRLAGNWVDASVTLAFCWAHLRRPFFEFHASTQSPLAARVLAEIARLYAIEAEIRGQSAERRRDVRQERSRPIVEALHAQGAFRGRSSANYVAAVLTMGRATVYKILKQMKEGA